MSKELKDCTCEKCVDACKHTPGWFAPGEAEKAAEYLGIPFDIFKEECLIEDYWVSSVGYEHVLAPRKIGIEEDRQVASWGYSFDYGQCVFLVNNRCAIHKFKPYECRNVMPCDYKAQNIRQEIHVMWQKQGDKNV